MGGESRDEIRKARYQEAVKRVERKREPSEGVASWLFQVKRSAPRRS